MTLPALQLSGGSPVGFTRGSGVNVYDPRSPYPTRGDLAKQWLVLDAPLDADINQTLLPVIDNMGEIWGWVPVTSQKFTAGSTSGSVTIGTQTFALRTVTLPKMSSTASPSATYLADNAQLLRGRSLPVRTGNSDRQHVGQYMAMVFDLRTSNSTLTRGPVTGHRDQTPPNINSLPGLIRARGPERSLRYMSFWQQPTIYIKQLFAQGPYLNAQMFDLDPTVAPVNPPPAPTPTDGTIRWATELDPSTLNTDCEFLDFNWVQLFQLSPYVDGLSGSVVPFKIDVTTQDATGTFKAMVLQSIPGGIVGQGAVQYDTIRVLRLKDVATAGGTFTFAFNISYGTSVGDAAANAAVPVTLTLTVPAMT